MRESIRRDAQQPGGEGNSAPVVIFEILQRAAEYIGGYVFGLGAIRGPADDECPHTMKMALVELQEARRIVLRRLHQGLLIDRLRSRHGSPLRVTGEEGEKLRGFAQV